MPVEPGTSCPVGCGRTRGVGKLMCLPCWRQVPKHLQSDVYRTWRALRRVDRTGAAGEYPARAAAYTAAAEAAISAAA